MAGIYKGMIVLLSLFFVTAAPATAQNFARIDLASVIICPAGDGIPSFNEPGCEPLVDNRIDTQHRHIWLKAPLDLPEDFLTNTKPLAVFVRAKAASRVFLNGVLVGENGRPGSNAAEEIPGLMDASFYVDQSLLRESGNQLVLELSGHHSLITLSYPFHALGIGPYAGPREYIMRGYIRSLLPIGILLAGALYFGALAIRRREDLTSVLIPLIALFAAAQLLAEVSRGFVAYTYPMQDVRLVLVLFFAFASGFCLLLHVVDRFVATRKPWVISVGVMVMMVAIAIVPGFDGRAVMALLVPAIVGSLIAWRKARKGNKTAVAYTLALVLFALLTIPAGFLNIYFYYSVAGLLLFLFGVEIKKNAEEKRLRALEEDRANRLQRALDESREHASPSQLKISSQGKVEVISSDQIAVCKGARDYVELEVENRGMVLHDSSLSQLEKSLPSTFLRVHRSYLVNTGFIRSLERDASGSGRLHLKSGAVVPVSRRILPKVRKALN